MTDDMRVLPHVCGPSGSTLLRVHASSKLAFVATTVALVTLASGGTAVLISHATGDLSRPSALRAGSPLTGPGSRVGPEAGAVVVDRAPGTYPATPFAPAVGTVPTRQALDLLLAPQPPAGPPGFSLPVAAVGASQADVKKVKPPVVKPPVVKPPVGKPPVVKPPVGKPPVVVPPRAPHVPGVPSPGAGRRHSPGKPASHTHHGVGHRHGDDRGGSGRARHGHPGRHRS